MKLAFFRGCQVTGALPAYGSATEAVLARLGVRLVELPFGCCGDPIRSLRHDAFLLAAARNLALADARGLSIVTPCKCCFGALKGADYALRSDAAACERVGRELAREGLAWRGDGEVLHLLGLLVDRVGTDAIAAAVTRPQQGLRVAPHYGCHALRPSNVTRFDNPHAPTIFERLVAATGAEPIAWPRRLDCCGHPLRDRNEALSLELRRVKLADAREAGADCVCTACTYCQLQLGGELPDGAAAGKGQPRAVLVTDLLAAALELPVPAASAPPFR